MVLPIDLKSPLIECERLKGFPERKGEKNCVTL